MGLETTLGRNNGVGCRACRLTEEVAEHLQLAPDDFAGGIKGFIGRPFAGGVKTGAFPAHQLQQGGPASCFFKGGDHHQQRALIPSGHGTGHQCATGTSGAAHQQAVFSVGALKQFSGEGSLLELGHQGTQGHEDACQRGSILAIEGCAP